MKYFSVEARCFSLRETFECGQCFRWRGDGEEYCGVVGGRRLFLKTEGEKLLISGCGPADYEGWLAGYLGLNQDYDAYKRLLSQDEVLRAAIGFAPGIRVMHQDFWETLCSFIISQNNNIPRIMGIIDRLCEGFGDDCGGYYAFPSAERLASLDPQDLSGLRSGFRAAYIIDAARRVASGEIDEAFIKSAPLDESRAMLMRIKGVGPKVADCALLFGAGRLDAFPVDVWIRRAMERLFPAGLPDFAAPIAGIAQQYIFHYARKSGAL